MLRLEFIRELGLIREDRVVVRSMEVMDWQMERWRVRKVT